MNQHENLKTQRFDRPGIIAVVGSGESASHLVQELKLLGHSASLSQNISQALENIRAASPDLIIICLDAFGTKGFDLSRAVKADPLLQEIPVLIFSTTDDALEQMCAFECGANDILICPKNRKILGARVKVLLKYHNAVRELRTSHAHLEDRVRERTEELERANRKVLREYEERAKAEEALRRSEEALRQFQKVQALGQLAGGVAHDFNNILFIIMGYAETLKNGLEPGHRLQRAVDQIQRASDRAASLTRQLLAFGRRQVLQPRVLDLAALLRDTSMMIQRALGEHIRLAVDCAPTLGHVKFDPIQIDQIILNLAVNARDAMPGGGELRIELENAPQFEPHQLPPGIRPGDYVCMSVVDSGCGMDEATRAHIFEPFFTTKPAGKGTGLGLATVFGIVSQSGGWIDVYSEVGKGTRFDVYLPRTIEALSSPQLPAVCVTSATRKATVLVVEDDPIVRELLRTILKRAHFGVLEAGDGLEALELLEGGAKPDVLLTDILMPEINGAELVRRIKPKRPDLRVIYMSAHTDEVLGSLEEDAFIQKPFLARAVVRKIQESLSEAS